jgi:hypothetical protein
VPSTRGGAALLATALCALSTSWAPRAHADDADVCMSAPVEGQKLHKEGKLLAAREKFTMCARKTCPAEIVQDCTRWAGEVDAALPTVVTAARDQAGHDLGDVTVSVDGKPAVPLSPRATSVDPGAHKFVFHRAASVRGPGVAGVGAGVAIEQVTILREGEKNREVAATFRVPGVTSAPTSGVLATERPVPVAAWVSGAVGVAGLGVLGVAGVLGVSQRSADHCDTGCPQAQKSGVDNLFNVADVGLAVGVVGVGLAAVLFLVRPTVERPAAYLDLRPAPGGGVAVVGGRF